MNLIPAIDLKNGKCVRLYQGDFDRVTEYETQPAQLARDYETLSVRELHIVDLDGARTGAQQNQRVVRDICEHCDLDVQLGGGIRDRQALLQWLDHGIARCVIGSAAADDREAVIGWLSDIGPDRITLALDVRLIDMTPVVATHGWTRSSGRSLWDTVDAYADAGLRHVLCTDVGRDGALAGPNFGLYAEFVRRYPHIRLQASGGVRDAADLRQLRGLGVPATVTGKALLDGRITRAEVRSFLRNA